MATLQRCEKGHFYDTRKHTACPVCQGPSSRVEETRAHRPQPAVAETVARREPVASHDEEGATKAVRPEQGQTVGWLVCVEGPDKGRDYRIRSGRNFIGRQPKMQICIAGDESIHRENHASVTYDPRRVRFSLAAGMVEDFVYLNGDIVEPAAPKVLVPYDVIELGKTRLMFVPFCGEKFQWPE